MIKAAKERNDALIRAILEKEKTLCPGAVALIGIYGSFLTGDIQPLSDLDLLILIGDERGWQLGTTFIQDDVGIGHDIYCTSWESLREDARYEHPHISKLMDSKIVYCQDQKHMDQLEALRTEVRKKLAEPFGEEDYQKAEKTLKEVKCCYANAMASENLSEIRREAGGVLYYTECAVAMLNKTYFHKGVRRRYEELSAMEKRPSGLCERMEAIVGAGTAEKLKNQLTLLMKELTACFAEAKQAVRPEKEPASAENLRGTYEEMFSNWHGKMVLAEETGDRHLAFMTLESLNAMMEDIGGECDIPSYDVLDVYDPTDLTKTRQGFDRILQEYLREYQKAGLNVKRFPDIDSFIKDYLA